MLMFIAYLFGAIVSVALLAVLLIAVVLGLKFLKWSVELKKDDFE